MLAFQAGILATTAAFGVLLARSFYDTPAPWRRDGACVVAVLAGLLIALPAGAPLPFLLWTGGLVTGLLAIALIDLQTRTVPDLLSLPLIGLGLLHATLALGEPLLFAAGAAAAGLTLFLVGRLARLLVGGDTVGGADVLLAAAGGAWLGPLAAIDAALLAVAYCLPSLAAAGLQTRRIARRDIPFCPALAAGIATAWLLGPLFH